MNANYLNHAAELWTTTGPTGDHVEVIRGEVQDYGGNVLFAGTADECLEFDQPNTGRNVRPDRGGKLTRLIPTEWRRVTGEVAGAKHQWQLVTV